MARTVVSLNDTKIKSEISKQKKSPDKIFTNLTDSKIKSAISNRRKNSDHLYLKLRYVFI